MFDRLRDNGFDIEIRNHADAILTGAFPEAVEEIERVLVRFTIRIDEIIAGGGGEASPTQRLRRAFTDLGWHRHNFDFRMMVDGEERIAVSHEIDHVKRFERGTIALEIEWNNKDPFFDRDLENFQRLHVQSAISLGIIITRGRTLQDRLEARIREHLENNEIRNAFDLPRIGIAERTRRQRENVSRLLAQGRAFPDAFAHAFVADKFGQATTHWAKLMDRVNRGVGNPCPLALIGLPETIIR